ncbi:LysR family transcriptional regulator [Novosphingobium sp. Rr 2-17]|uniref:LysR family transcriptional regulator n=1 Tax=Novosphingobium sp. Rr 2-17 TaxID=555793 RepID=UPI00063F76FC|nr:LysR family transcriptional regulator [Novosphingobium sp. Rr 2-17]
MLDRYLLRYFLAVVDQGTFSRAAAQCNVSQPTLSVGIAKLERSLGTTLFFRSSQRVQLTADGTRFLTHARRIETEFNLAQQAMTAVSSAPVLRIGILHSIPGEAIAAAVAATLADAPETAMEILYGTERELVAHVARGRVDVALTLVDRGGDRFLERTLAQEGYALAVPDHHPLSQRDQIAAEELSDNVMMVRRHCEALSETSRYFIERGVRPRFAMRTTNDERILQMVAAGLGVTIMPTSYRHPGVARPRLAGFDLRRSLGFTFAHDAERFDADPPAFLQALGSGLKNLCEGAASGKTIPYTPHDGGGT